MLFLWMRPMRLVNVPSRTSTLQLQSSACLNVPLIPMIILLVRFLQDQMNQWWARSKRMRTWDVAVPRAANGFVTTVAMMRTMCGRDMVVPPVAIGPRMAALMMAYSITFATIAMLSSPHPWHLGVTAGPSTRFEGSASSSPTTTAYAMLAAHCIIAGARYFNT